jgi:hypothetical protein
MAAQVAQKHLFCQWLLPQGRLFCVVSATPYKSFLLSSDAPNGGPREAMLLPFMSVLEPPRARVATDGIARIHESHSDGNVLVASGASHWNAQLTIPGRIAANPNRHFSHVTAQCERLPFLAPVSCS